MCFAPQRCNTSKMDREWCVFADFDYLQMSFLRQRRAILAPGARVRPSTNHWVSYQPTIGYLTNQLSGILPTDGYVLGFCFTVLVLRLSFRVWLLGFWFRVLGFRVLAVGFVF